MKKIQYILAATALLLLPTAAGAQKQAKDSTMNRTVVVEQQYNPDIVDAAKINILPQIELPVVTKKEVEYDNALAPSTQVPATTMQAYGAKERQEKAAPGYFRVGYGTAGNLDLLANYLFRLSNKDKLNLSFGIDGSDGKVKSPHFDLNEGYTPSIELPEKWKSYHYHTNAALDYAHAFRRVDLNIAGNFDLRNFNLAPSSPYGRQKFTSGDLHIGLLSTDDELPLQFHAETNLLLFQRRFFRGKEEATEYIWRTRFGATGSISPEQRIGVDIALDNLFYSAADSKGQFYVNANPHYLYENNDWKIRIGAHIDFASRLDEKLRVAPDITAHYNFSDSYTLYAQAKGGRILSDFRRMALLSPHADYSARDAQPNATYEQLNAAVGFKMSPVAGLWFNIYGGYQDLKNDLAPTIDFFETTYQLYLENAHTHNAYAGAEVSYDHKNIVALTVGGVYRNWSAKEKQGALLFKPAFEANLQVDIRPLSALLINLGYEHTSRTKVAGASVSSIENLYIGGQYTLFDNLSVYIRANNLLNKNYQYYPYYSVQGLHVMGGVSFRF